MTLQRGRMLAYPKVAKQVLEFVLLLTVIVRVEHTKEYALSETAWSDEKEVARLFLNFWQEHCLVHIVKVLLDNLGKISHSVWYLFYLLLHHCLLFNVTCCKDNANRRQIKINSFILIVECSLSCNYCFDTTCVLNECGCVWMFRYFLPIFTDNLAGLSVKLPAVMMYWPLAFLKATTGVLL